MRREEPVHQSLIRPITFFGVQRDLLVWVLIPGVVLFMLGMMSRHFLLVAFAVVATVVCVAFAAVITARYPNLIALIADELFWPRRYVPNAGLRGRQGV